jgi:hypothetical protein
VNLQAIENLRYALTAAERLRIVKWRWYRFPDGREATRYEMALTDYLSKVAEHVAAEQAQGQWYRPNVAAFSTGDETAHTEIVGDRMITDK